MTTSQLLIAFIPLVGWGLGDIFGVVASRKIGSYLTTFYQFLFGIILTTFLLPYFWNNFPSVSVGLLLFNITIGSLYVLANFFVNEGFKQASAPIVGIIIQSFPAITLIFSTLIFRDPLNSKQIFWILMVFIGVLMCSVDIKALKSRGFKFDVGIKYALAATTIFAFYFTFFRLFANQYGWFLPNYISFLTLPIALYLAKLIIKEKSSLSIPKKPKILTAALVSAILIRSGDIALNLGISQGLGSLVTPMAGAAPVVFVIASSLIFKDKISRQQFYGILTTLLGILGLSFLV